MSISDKSRVVSHQFVIIFLLIYFVQVNNERNCEFHERVLNYYKIRDCYKSTLTILARTITSNLQDCMKFARQKRALAFNFSPDEVSEYRNFSLNCQVLGCPETEKSTTLVGDVAFDYYSAYGNWNMTENDTCIHSVGLFTIIEDKQNYNKSIETCHNIGAELANVLSEIRTNRLSQYINDTLHNWYNVAYISLNDIQVEGNFETTLGMMLKCFRYRAWAPGHPRSKHRNEDCVVLDSDRMWRVVECKRKLPALCEFYPAKPLGEIDFQNVTCDQINNEERMKDCNSTQIISNLHKNATRMDICSVIYDVYGKNSEE